MQRFLAILAILLVPSMLMAQDAADKASETPPPVVKPSRDFIMVNLAYSNWYNKPDSVKIKGFGYNFSTYLCYDFPIKKTNLSFAAGLGIHASVVYLDKQVMMLNDTAFATSGQVRFLSDTFGYKRYKFATTYIQAPFELRYFGNANNRNKGFKAAIGVQVGALLGGHTKAASSANGSRINYKTNTKRYLSPWNFAATARMGWGNFSVYGSYNITNVFRDGAGPVITPYSIGLCITGL